LKVIFIKYKFAEVAPVLITKMPAFDTNNNAPVSGDMKSCVVDKYGQEVDVAMVGLLIDKAKNALANSHSPYSQFKVGAALLDTKGNIHVGVNVENASYGLTICAERSAMVSAVSQGEKSFRVIAIASSSDRDEFCPPCGACRQFLVEFGDFPVIMTKNTSDEILVSSTHKLLPGSFSTDFLDFQK